MRHFFITLYLLGISLFSSAQQEEKVALLITHYGSSDPQTRALTLDVVTREAQEAFPQFTVREAYISPIVRKRLAKEGVYKDSPTDALLKLRAEGYRTIYVQSTTLIEGSEMTSVRRDADNLRPFFKEIRVGNPLLYSVEDCEKVIDILTAEQPEKKEDIVYVGHGNQLPSTATYAMLDFMMKAHGLKNFHVSTIEGYPTLDATLLQLKETRPKSVTLVPLLLVCGNHTKEDIAGVWKTELEKQGYQVNVRMQGLGENKAPFHLFLKTKKQSILSHQESAMLHMLPLYIAYINYILRHFYSNKLLYIISNQHSLSHPNQVQSLFALNRTLLLHLCMFRLNNHH